MEEAYLPSDKEDRNELPIPRIPLLLVEEFKKPEAPIKEIVIDASMAAELRVELRESGITESVIYPDLDGLSRELDQLWKDRR